MIERDSFDHLFISSSLSVTRDRYKISSPSSNFKKVHGELGVDDADCDFVLGEDGTLQTTAEAEDTTVEEVDGVLVDTTAAVSAVAELEGRGRRKRTENKQYSNKALKWWSNVKKK
jgi:hypothetical protein